MNVALERHLVAESDRAMPGAGAGAGVEAATESPFAGRPGIRIGGRSSAVVRMVALVASILVHATLLLAIDRAPAAPAPEPELLVRLVFVEPPPPPPPPAEVAAVKPVAPVVETKKQNTVRRTPKRPMPLVEEPVEVPAPVEPAAPETEIARAPAGVPGGVAAGIEGGTVGGVVGGRGRGPVPAGLVARPPLLVKQVTPDYPELARRRRIEGLVLLEAVLDREGRVEDPIRVLESVAALDAAAIDALREWRFAPARDDTGDPVRVILEVPIRFVLR